MEQLMKLMPKVAHFITRNQLLIGTIATLATFLIKTLVDKKAKDNPEIDIWDKVKPGSDALANFVHTGVEKWGKFTGNKGTTKLAVALKVIQEFTQLWEKKGKLAAISHLQMWYLSMQAKKDTPMPNPSIVPSTLTKDTPAVEQVDGTTQ